MKTILWATLSANGNYATSSQQRPPMPEALQDFAAQAKKAGNVIVGRKTFEGFRAGGPNPAFEGLEIVVVSQNTETIPGATVVHSPQAALQHLEEKGYDQALLSGGETLHNAFLAAGLVNEVIFNFSPVFEPNGMKLILPADQFKDIQLVNVRNLGSGVIQHHYSLQ